MVWNREWVSKWLRREGNSSLPRGLTRYGPGRPALWVLAGSAFAATTVLLVAIGRGGLLRAEDAANPPAPTTDPATPGAAGVAEMQADAQASGRLRLREGTTLRGLVGSIRPLGERWTLFLSQRDERYVLLENLALERILRTNASFTEAPDWTIDGTITEFRGQNYLLIEKALLGRVTPASSNQ